MKAVLYCRVDGPQTSFALDAIKGQQLYLMDYAKKNNIEIAGIYLDVGYHGRTMDRPGLQSVIQTLKEGNADVILVANYNRLYRGRFPQELQELPVVSLKEQNRKRERGGKEHDIDPALSAMMAEPWSNGACRGYVIMAMENCGFSSDDIRRMMAELHELFDFVSLEEAEAHYQKAFSDFETLCPKVE